MIQRTVSYYPKPAARVVAQSSDAALPLTFLALAFGVIAGVGIAGVVIPVIVEIVIPAVVRALAGV